MPLHHKQLLNDVKLQAEVKLRSWQLHASRTVSRRRGDFLNGMLH